MSSDDRPADPSSVSSRLTFGGCAVDSDDGHCGTSRDSEVARNTKFARGEDVYCHRKPREETRAQPPRAPPLSPNSVPNLPHSPISASFLMSFRISVCSSTTSPFWTCSNTTLSLLGAVERQLVMNLLWLESSIPISTMSSWVTKEGKPCALSHALRFG